jgi:hypothetical protein
MMGKEEEHDASFFFKWSFKKCGTLNPGETPLEIPVVAIRNRAGALNPAGIIYHCGATGHYL